MPWHRCILSFALESITTRFCIWISKCPMCICVYLHALHLKPSMGAGWEHMQLTHSRLPCTTGRDGWWQCAALLLHLSAMAEDRMQFPAKGRAGGWSGSGAGGMQRNIKGPWKLSGTWVLPALRANSPVLTHPVVHPDDSFCTVLGNTWVRIKIPFHLEAQTPSARTLSAAIRSLAAWGVGHSLSPLPP